MSSAQRVRGDTAHTSNIVSIREAHDRRAEMQKVLSKTHRRPKHGYGIRRAVAIGITGTAIVLGTWGFSKFSPPPGNVIYGINVPTQNAPQNSQAGATAWNARRALFLQKFPSAEDQYYLAAGLAAQEGYPKASQQYERAANEIRELQRK